MMRYPSGFPVEDVNRCVGGDPKRTVSCFEGGAHEITSQCCRVSLVVYESGRFAVSRVVSREPPAGGQPHYPCAIFIDASDQSLKLVGSDWQHLKLFGYGIILVNGIGRANPDEPGTIPKQRVTTALLDKHTGGARGTRTEALSLRSVVSNQGVASAEPYEPLVILNNLTNPGMREFLLDGNRNEDPVGYVGNRKSDRLVRGDIAG